MNYTRAVGSMLGQAQIEPFVLRHVALPSAAASFAVVNSHILQTSETFTDSMMHPRFLHRNCFRSLATSAIRGVLGANIILVYV